MSERILVVASKNYSSWSVRPWLVLRYAGIPFREQMVNLFVAPDWESEVRKWSPSGKVPVLIEGDLRIHESLAICEYLAECFPEARLWPEDPGARALARAVSAEMAAGFGELRSTLPMNARGQARGFTPTPGAQADIERIDALFASCRQRHGSGGPYLFGAFSIADAMYAPVMSRFRTYGVTLSGPSQDYLEALERAPVVQEWLTLVATEPTIPKYDALLD
jgi:glutathione S-transferase